MNLEAALAGKVGPVAGKLHTGRSRNDQVATDLRLWTRRAIDELDAALVEYERALVGLAEREGTAILPGTTHIQPAQPVLLAHHLLAYVEMAERDRARLADARRRVNVSPLGVGCAGRRRLPARSRGDGGRARLRWRQRQLDGRRRRSRLRGRDALGGRARDGPPQPAGRGDHVVVEPALRVHPGVRCVLDGQLDHAEQEEPGSGRAGPRPRGPGHRRADRIARAAEGPAAGVPARPPGGQGAAVRCGGRVRDVAARACRAAGGGDGRP